MQRPWKERIGLPVILAGAILLGPMSATGRSEIPGPTQKPPPTLYPSERLEKPTTRSPPKAEVPAYPARIQTGKPSGHDGLNKREVLYPPPSDYPAQPVGEAPIQTAPPPETLPLPKPPHRPSDAYTETQPDGGQTRPPNSEAPKNQAEDYGQPPEYQPRKEEHGRSREGRRHDDQRNTHQATHVQQSVSDAASRAGEEGGVLPVRRGGRPASASDLTSQIENVAEGLSTKDQPPASSPPDGPAPGPKIYYTPSGTPIHTANEETGTPGNPSVPSGTRTRTTTTGSPTGPTRERQPWPGTTPRPPVPREFPEDIPLAPPPGSPPSAPPETEDEKPCCGMLGGVVFFPKIIDWQKPAEEQQARNDPARSAQGVLLHDGSFAHDQPGLHVKSVGFPLQIGHHYKSNLTETVRGGIIGHKWDLGINKRLVAEGAGETADHLVFERLGTDTPRLIYHDGHGRADRYSGASSEIRTVRNFGHEFKALVTTYASPPGAFHEIQRYVLLPGFRHPFQKHVDVDESQRIFYVLREKNGLQYIFNCRGQLIHIIDRHQNRMELRHQGPLNPLTHNTVLSEVLDTAGRRYVFETINLPADEAMIGTNIRCGAVTGKLPIPRFQSITEEATGRKIAFRYKDGMYPVLVEVTLNYDRALRHTYTYTGAEDYLLESITAPEQARSGGDPYLTNTWDAASKRVTAQKWGNGTYRLAYTGGVRVTSAEITDPVGTKLAYELVRVGAGPVVQEFRITEKPGTSGGPFIYRTEHDDTGLVTRITQPRGNSVMFTYESGNKPVTLGPIRNWVERDLTYANNLQQGNLRSVTWRSHDPGDPYNEITIARIYEDLYNQIRDEVDQRGNRTRHLYAYDRGTGFNGKPYETLLPDLTRPGAGKLAGLKISYSYDGRGLLISETAPGDRITTHDYDTAGYLTRMTTPAGTTDYAVDTRGNVISRAIPGGRTDRFTYNLRDLLTESVADSTGFANKATLEYDYNGNITRRITEIKDNFDSRISSGTKPAPAAPGQLVETFVYDILNRETQAITQGPGVSQTITRRHDGAGNVIEMTGPSIGGAGTITTQSRYDARQLVVEEVEDFGSDAETRKSFRYDDNGNLTAYFGPESLEETYSHDGFDRMKSKVLVTGALATFERDRAGNITRLSLQGDSGQKPGPQLDIVELSRSEYVYDELNQLITHKRHILTSPGTVDEHWIYNAALDVEILKGPGKGETRRSFDKAGRVVAITDPTGTITRHEYDEAGNSTAVTEEWTGQLFRQGGGWQPTRMARRWSSLNDRLGRVVQQAGPDGTSRHFHDSMSNPRGVLDGEGQLVSRTYDGLGRLTAVIANGQTETYSYSAGGRMTRAQSLLRNETWQYNAMGALLVHTDAKAGRTTRHQLDGNGVAIRTTDPNGTVIERELDAAGKPETITIAPASGLTIRLGNTTYSGFEGPTREEYRYDALGRIAYAATSKGNIVERKYDGLGNVIEETQTSRGDRQTIRFQSASDLTRQTVTYPQIAGSTEITQLLDDASRVTSVLAGGANIARFAYHGKGYQHHRHYSNFVDTAYNYDDRLRLTGIHIMHGAGAQSYKTYWTGRAEYDGAIPKSMLQTFGTSDGPTRLTRVDTRLDAMKRPVGTIANHATTASGNSPATSMTTGILREYDAAGRLRTAVEYQQDDLAPQGRIAGKLLHVQSDIFSYNAAGRISATSSRVNRDIDQIINPELPQAKSLAEQGTNAHLQDFHYDRNGNLLADDRFVYAYDHHNRLTRIQDRWQPYRFEAQALIEYDALGRRVFIRNRQPPPTAGFVQWGPTYIPDVRFLYHGNVPIAETLHNHPAHRAELLLARYYYGNGPEDLIRMDRRRDDNPLSDFASYYVHQGFSGQIAMLSDEIGDALNQSYLEPPGRDRPGAAGSFSGDMIVAGGTRTRMPYTAETIRLDGFAGMEFNLSTGRYLFDFQRNHVLERDLSTLAFRESITRFQNRSAIIAIAISSLPFTLTSSSALMSGVIGLGLDMGTALHARSGYTVEEGVTSFVISATGARLGMASSAASVGLGAQFAAGYAMDVAFGTLVDHAWFDRPFSEALSSNMKQSAIFGTAGMVTGIAVPTTIRTAAKLYRNYLAPRATKFTGTSPSGGAAIRRAAGNSADDAVISHCPLCFAKDTRVLIQGGWKPIQDIRPGDKVLSRDERSGAVGYKTVTETFVTHPPSFVHLFYRLRESGRHDADADAAVHQLAGTANHPIWSADRGRWVDLAALKPGETLMLANGEPAQAIRVEVKEWPEGTPLTAYNFSVKDWASYFVAPVGADPDTTAIWVHNTSFGPGCGRDGSGANKPARVNLAQGNNLQLQKLATTIHRELESYRRAKMEAGSNEFLLYDSNLEVIEAVQASHNANNPIYVYRAITQKTSDEQIHLYRGARQGRAASMGRSTDYRGHVLGEMVNTDATSWTTDLNVALEKFGGKKPESVLLVANLADVADQIITSYDRNWSRHPHEAEILLKSSPTLLNALKVPILKQAGVNWRPIFLSQY